MQREEGTDEPPDAASLTDAELLARFVDNDEAAAFRTLVERHGPLVLGVCRRSLNSLADADDAFQATFLVLAQSAGKIRRRESLAAWLYGVASRVSLRMRRQGTRAFPGREVSQMDEPTIEQDPLDELLARHDARVADEELAALPTKLRTPLVLRYLAGKTNAEVAEELGITVAALEGRLKRGKQQLRLRLIRRGVLLATLVATLKATQVAASELPSELVDKTLDRCLSTGADALTAASATDHPATIFAREELIAMKSLTLIKPLMATAALGGVMTLAVAVQMALADGPSRSGASGVALQADAALGNEAAPVVRLSRKEEAKAKNDQADAWNDPFADPPRQPTAQTLSLSSDQSPPPAQARRVPDRQFADAKPRTPSEQRIEAALAQPLSRVGLDFTATPLEEIIEFLREEYRIEIKLDTNAIDEIGIGPDEPVTVNLRDIGLESALRLMLRPHDLTFLVRDEVLMITTAEEAQAVLESRIYPIRNNAYADRLVEIIKAVVAPTTWAPDGGEAEVMVLEDRLVIRQTYANHAEINRLLLQLNEQQAASDATSRSARPSATK